MSGMEPLMLANMGLSVLQQNAQVKKQNAAARTAYEANVQRINAKNAADERKRLKDLQRVSAQQRAMFAARGVSPEDGSASAVLQGLQVESDVAAAERARERAMSLSPPEYAEGQPLAQTLAVNLLERHGPALSSNLSKLLQWDNASKGS